MRCSESWPVEVTERYLRRELNEPLATAFEEHYFACDECFGGLRDLRAIQGELVRTRHEVEAADRIARPARQLALAAALVLGLTGALSLSRRGPTPVQAPVTTAAAALEELARIEPPAFSQVRLRGPVDDASLRFRKAMEPYARGDWTAALPLLREAERLDSRAPGVAFYRGACALLLGNVPEAIDSLHGVVALGETSFLEEARFYLAKAHLMAGDIPAAREELRRVVEIGGHRREGARWLLQHLNGITSDAP